MDINVNGVNITLTKDQLKQIDEQVKKMNEPKKPSPEERFWQLCEGLVMKTDWIKYPDSVFFFKKDECWFEYDLENSVLWCKWSCVWSVFENEYQMYYDNIQKFIKNLVEQHFKMKGVTPHWDGSPPLYKVEQHFKMKGVTPRSEEKMTTLQVEQHFKMKGVTPNKMVMDDTVEVEEHFKNSKRK